MPCMSLPDARLRSADNPIFSHPAGRTSYVELDKLAVVRGVQRAVTLGSILIGLLHSPKTHDLRYGSAIAIDLVSHHVIQHCPQVQRGRVS